MAVWSEVDFAELENKLRLEAEFYQPFYLAAYEEIRRCGLPVVPLRSLCRRVTDGSHITPDYQEEGIRFLMVRDVREETIEFENSKFITDELDEKLKHCKPCRGDVLLSKVGSIGIAAVVPDDAPEFNIFVSLAVIKGIHGVDPFYLSAFLNSRFGRVQAFRQAKGISQPDLHLQEIREFLVPVPDQASQNLIKSLLLQAKQKRSQSIALYAEAENLLLHELGLDTLDLSHELTYERDFKEVAAADRFDAQYFHPEKQHVLEQLAKLPGKPVSYHFESINETLAPPATETGEHIQNYDLDDALRFFLDDIRPMPSHELGSMKKRFKRGDVVVSRLRSYLKEIAVAETSLESNCVGSSEFIVLRSTETKQLSPELLVVYLRSSPVQKILKWCQNGSNHPRFNEDEMLSIKVPERIFTVQDEVNSIIRKAIQCHSDAKQLLEDAKRQVERLILGEEAERVA